MLCSVPCHWNGQLGRLSITVLSKLLWRNTQTHTTTSPCVRQVHPLCKIHFRTSSVALCTQMYRQTDKQTNYVDYLLTKYTALFLSAGGNWVSGCSNPAWVRTTNRTRQSPFSRKFRICDMFSSWLVILDHLSGFTCMVTLWYTKNVTFVHYTQGCIDHFCRLWSKASSLCPVLMKVVKNGTVNQLS